jgi:NTE family protein
VRSGTRCSATTIHHCDSSDVLIVHTNPLRREQIPHTATGILNHINEIGFNSSLMREMRAIVFATSLVDEDEALSKKLKKIHITVLRPTKWRLLWALRASRWLKENFNRFGRESTVDISATFL